MGIRLDKLLFYLRLAKSRSIAEAMIETGHMRVNGHRVGHKAQMVGLGDILTLAMGQNIRVIRILTLPIRRGPAKEAQSHYQELDVGANNLIAGD